MLATALLSMYERGGGQAQDPGKRGEPRRMANRLYVSPTQRRRYRLAQQSDRGRTTVGEGSRLDNMVATVCNKVWPHDFRSNLSGFDPNLHSRVQERS